MCQASAAITYVAVMRTSHVLPPGPCPTCLLSVPLTVLVPCPRGCLPPSLVPQSAKSNLNVDNVFFTIARDIKQRLAETAEERPEVGGEGREVGEGRSGGGLV